MNPKHLLEHAIRPALNHMGMGGNAAEQLVLGTAIVESNLTYLRQHNNGPALGFWQMEPTTHDDIYKTYLEYRRNLRKLLSKLTTDGNIDHIPIEDRQMQMTWNLRYGAAMCRLKYYRSPDALPEAGDYEGLATFHKLCYNSPLGHTDVTKSTKKFKNVVDTF